MSALSVVELFAGYQPDGTPVVERLPVKVLEDNSCQLVRSPSFVQGIASGDVIKLHKEDRAFELVRRSGNLCIRIIAKEDISAIAEDITPLLEKLGGELDFENERMLVFSIHVSCGFKTIEALLNDHIGDETESMWAYGNVYDPKDGETPLDWWKAILEER